MTHTNLNRILFSLCLCVSALVLSAQTYQSEILARIGKRVALPAQYADSAAGYYDAGVYQGMQLTVGIDDSHTITHLGYKIFMPELKTTYPSVVYDFIERYFLELDAFKSETYLPQKLADDKLSVLEGAIDSIRKVTFETPFMINCVDDKNYQVTWSNGDKCLLCINFPADFELILGMPKVEIEKKIHQQIAGTPPSLRTIPVPKDLVREKESVFRTNPISNYYVESLNTATYYKKQGKDSFEPIYSPEQKLYSAANLFQGVIDSIADYKLYIEQNLYGFKTDKFTVSLSQWIDYCRSMKMTTYFAIEEEREDGLKALLIAQSKELGFNHMMSIIIPFNFVEKKNTILKAYMNAYIPTQNVKDLYQQLKKRPKIKYE